jgi:hypothetical protein
MVLSIFTCLDIPAIVVKEKGKRGKKSEEGKRRKEIKSKGEK